jgi:hypothetical protein
MVAMPCLICRRDIAGLVYGQAEPEDYPVPHLCDQCFATVHLSLLAMGFKIIPFRAAE